MRSHGFLLLLLLLLLPSLGYALQPPFSCDSSNPTSRSFAFCDSSLPINKRVDNLISHMSLDEKISQLGDIAPAIPRLGVPAYKWWSESLHGVSNGGRGMHLDSGIRAATSFPQVILTGASFNPELWYRIGQAIAVEARGIYNQGQAEGLTLWSPNINIFRDPRWGRGQETPGEDPMATSKYAVAYVRGLQGDTFHGVNSTTDLKTSACCKHFTAYDLDNWHNITRYVFDAQVTTQDMEDTYQPPFRSCIKDGRASGLMCSYNRVNGVPTCADYDLLSKTAREEWKFNGYITSDCDAVSIIHDAQGYAKAPEDAVADVLKAGMDVNCGGYVQQYAASAYQKGKITEGDINRALHNLFTVRMRLGLFNGNPKHKPYGNIGSSQVCTKEHQDLALQAAQDGIVLLKNKANVLPLSKSEITSLGVIGPNANSIEKLLGNYAGPPCTSVTPLQALQSFIGNTHYLPGCNSAACNSTQIAEAVKLAKSVDQVVMFMGLDLDQEREELDRVHLVLPGMQRKLINSVARAAKKPIILVLLSGGPIDISFAKHDPKIGGIMWGGYPGEAGGTAIAKVIFGEHNPGGRLPVTWYPQEFTRVPMTDMRMRSDAATGYPGRTYRFYRGRTVYKYGYGLSYSDYSHAFSSLSRRTLHLDNTTSTQQTIHKSGGITSYGIEGMSSEVCERIKFPVAVKVENHGPMDGRHPVLLFLRWPTASEGRPVKQLVGFQSVHLKAGETANVVFDVSPCEHLSRVMEDGRKVIDKGSHFLMVGKKEVEIMVV